MPPSTRRNALSRIACLAAAAWLVASPPPAAAQGQGSEGDAPPAVLSAPNAGSLPEALTHFSLGVQAELASDFEAALEEFEQAAALDSSAPDIAYHLSLCLYHLGRYQESLDRAKRALALGSTEGEVHWIAGNCLVALRRPLEAVEEFREATRLSPARSRFLLSLGNALEGIGRMQEAADAFRRAMREPEDATYARFRLATALLHSGDAAGAVVEFEALEKERPDLPGILEGLGASYQIVGRYDDAVAVYERAVRRAPGNIPLIMQYAEALAQAGRTDAAGEKLSELRQRVAPEGVVGRRMAALALRLNRLDDAIGILEPMAAQEPREADVHGLLAEAYSRAGLKAEARRELETILSWDPDRLEALLALGALDSSDGRYEEAVRVLRRAERRNRDHPRVLYLLGLAEMERGDTEGATKRIRRLIELEGERPPALFALGRIRERAGDIDGAVDAFRRLLKIDPKNAAAMNYIGYMYAERGVHLDQAVLEIQNALAIEPDNGYFIDSLGWAYYQQGRHEEARRHLVRAAELTGGDPVVLEHLGDAFRALGRPAEAVDRYRAALAKDPENRGLDEKIRKVGAILGQDGR